MNHWVKTLIITSGTGLLVGIVLGLVFTFSHTDVDFADLSAQDQMVAATIFAESYLGHGDFDRLQKDLSLFHVPNAGEFIMLMAERSILSHQPPEDICALVRVSTRFGYVTDSMIPYLDCEGGIINENHP